GVLDDRGVSVPGAAKYVPGERALIMLDQTPAREFRTWSMVVGKFNFVRDGNGTKLLMRGQDDETILGWDTTGRPYRDAPRAETKFLQFVHDEAQGRAGDDSYIVEESRPVSTWRIKANVNGSGFHACDYVDAVNNFGACGAKWKDIFDFP